MSITIVLIYGLKGETDEKHLSVPICNFLLIHKYKSIERPMEQYQRALGW